MPSTAPRHVALCVALLVVRGGAGGRFVANHLLLDSINAAGGLLILCISVVILDLQKVPLADYLPSLIVAPLLTWIFA